MHAVLSAHLSDLDNMYALLLKSKNSDVVKGL